MLRKKSALLFSIFEMPKVPVYGEDERKKHVRAIVRQVSKGNILLQSGHYLTKEDILELKEDLLNR